jgi:hypothetical protein
MAERARTSTLALPVDGPTLARLHGKACFHCGATGDLIPAGHVTTRGCAGARLGWAVGACVNCSDGPSS